MSCIHLRRGFVLASCAAGLIAATLPSAASAVTHAPTKWSIGFTDAYPAGSLNSSDPDYVEISADDGALAIADAGLLKIERAGSTIAHSYGRSTTGGWATLADLRAGDVATFYNPLTGAVYATATFDGLPSYDATTCDGVATLSGLRSGNASITDLLAYHWKDDANATYGSGSLVRTDINNGSLTTLNGPSFTGVFERPIRAGSILSASSRLIASPALTIFSTVERKSNACLPPPTPTPTPTPTPGPYPSQIKDTTAPKVTLSTLTKKPNRLSIKKLAAPGLSFLISSDEQGTVNASLMLQTPAKKQSKAKPPVTLTTVTATIHPGQPVTVFLNITKKQKKQLRHAPKGSKLAAHVTVTDASNNVSTLGDTSFKIPTQ